MNIFGKFLSVVKSFYINLKIFDFMTACRLPLLIKYNTKVIGTRKGCIELIGEITRGMISISITRGTLLGDCIEPSVLQFGKQGVWKVENKAWIAGYCVINVGGSFETKRFTANSGFKISCSNKIQIGDDVLIGWDVLIIDSDGHDILYDDVVLNTPRPVIIGDHVWMCAKTTIMKGAEISEGSVVAMGSITTKKFEKANLLISNNIIKRENIYWKH